MILAMSVCTWISGGVRGFQLLALSWWSSSNFRLMFSMDSWSISQKPARSWEMGRGCAFGFWHTWRQAYKHTVYMLNHPVLVFLFVCLFLSGSLFGIWMMQSSSDLGEYLACIVTTLIFSILIFNQTQISLSVCCTIISSWLCEQQQNKLNSIPPPPYKFHNKDIFSNLQ